MKALAGRATIGVTLPEYRLKVGELSDAFTEIAPTPQNDACEELYEAAEAILRIHGKTLEHWTELEQERLDLETDQRLTVTSRNELLASLKADMRADRADSRTLLQKWEAEFGKRLIMLQPLSQ